MIPSVVHYIWIGDKQPPSEILEYMKTWDKLVGYQIKKYDENFLIGKDIPNVIEAALKYKKYAFVTDWMRLKILYEEGGIYMDTDVEVCKTFSDIIEDESVALFLGFIYDMSLGTAVIGAERGNEVIHRLLEQYETARYMYDDNTKSFTIEFAFKPGMYMVNNNDMFTAYFLKYIKGFRLNGKKQLCGNKENILICPKEYFEGYSIDFKHNYTIHHCFGSWRRSESKTSGKLLNILKRIYIIRWIKDTYTRNHRNNLPFENYYTK